jgi:hypothetical protein
MLRALPVFALLVFLLNSCDDKPKGKSGFVTMEDGRFVLDGQPYFPMVLNYIVNLRMEGDEIWAAPYQGYTPGYRFAYADRDSSLLLMRADMELMRSMGFNAIRIVKLAEKPVRTRTNADLYLKVYTDHVKDTLLSYSDPTLFDRHMKAVQEVLQVANDAGLKVILLTTLNAGEEHVEEHWIKVARRLSGEKAILAFDLFNEPLYFDSLERSKAEVHDIVKHWRKLMQENAPDHLFTIGLQGIRETFEWDPNLLDVDFISFHPYEYEPDQVRNELYWYHDQVKVPWIVGETSLPADNDSVPYTMQQDFAARMLAQAKACGACGSSWWQYKDVQWGEFHSDHMGLMSLEGSTEVGNSFISVTGTVKPTAEVFRQFEPATREGECLRLPNYWNYSGHATSALTGRLVSEMNEPIAGGVVIAWDEYFSRSFHTITREDGTFELRGNFHFHHWMATATLHNWVRDDCRPSAYLTNGRGIPELHLGNLRLKKLDRKGR